MKKIFTILAMAAAMFAVTSCKDYPGIVYNVAIEGNATGDVVVTFPNGDFELNGKAGLAFHYSNDTEAKKSVNGTLLGEALESSNEDVRNFATSVNDGFSVTFKDTKAGGTYHVHITGYAKEPTTGIVVMIDKTFDYPEVAEK